MHILNHRYMNTLASIEITNLVYYVSFFVVTSIRSKFVMKLCVLTFPLFIHHLTNSYCSGNLIAFSNVIALIASSFSCCSKSFYLIHLKYRFETRYNLLFFASFVCKITIVAKSERTIKLKGGQLYDFNDHCLNTWKCQKCFNLISYQESGSSTIPYTKFRIIRNWTFPGSSLLSTFQENKNVAF